MTDGGAVAVRNVYVMLAYACGTIHADVPGRVGAEPFEHLHELFAEILARGVAAQVKRGLHRDYLRFDERLTTVRGRIDIGETLLSRASTPGGVTCSFDEYDPDTAFNRALKSVLILLLRHGRLSRQRRDALRRLLPYLDPVTLVSPRSVRWDAFAYHRGNATYRLLLGACELVARGLLPTHESGETALRSWLSDDAMSRLYERFLREYYALHHPELSPAAREVRWDIDVDTAIGLHHLPAMRTDVTLRRGDRALIIDAKYYSSTLETGAYGKLTVRSAHLYQVLAYAKNADTRGDGSVSGLLLYARTSAPEQPDLDITVQGTRIGARTLDLDRPWEDLRSQLEDALLWLEPHP